MLEKFILYDDYVYRAPLPTEQLPGSDPREIAVYKDSMDGGLSLTCVLGSVPATDDEGSSFPRACQEKKNCNQIKRKGRQKNTLVFADRHIEDDHIYLTRGADPMQTDGDQTIGNFSIPDLCFPPAHTRRDVEIMRSCVFSHMSEGLSKRKIKEVENRKVLTLQDSIFKACKRMVTNLEIVEDEKSKQVHQLKKKISSLKKYCEASEARVKEREEEIDNL
ncbi:hypothetical protein Adt_14371 [Abeliophyllum distichum]|uniref:Uncharacterized protein n=1 Tax=Abeliophyllum distichum TaxID=126358 RepID=A0ABD1TZG6_9LAMI